MKKNQRGFSLIELLIVVVIIGIVASIAIPNLLTARKAANEGSAQSIVRTLYSAQVTFAVTAGGGNFTDSLLVLGDRSLIDGQLAASSSKSGYSFLAEITDGVVNNSPSTFTIGAVPLFPSGVAQSGTRKFCAATDGVIRSNSINLSDIIAADGDCTEANYPNLLR